MDSERPIGSVKRCADHLRHRYGLAFALEVVENLLEKGQDTEFNEAVWQELNSDADESQRAWNPRLRGQERIVATSRTKSDQLSRSQGSYENKLTAWYMDDFAPRYGKEKGLKIAKKQARKQVEAHTFLTNLLRKYVRPGSRVVTPGSGFCHEAAIAPDYKWICLEFQPELVHLARQRDKEMRLTAKQKRWSAFDDDVASCQDQSCGHLLNKLGRLPRTDAVYLKHFCGGGTDSVLYTAVRQRVPVIILNTCCADRYAGISHAVLAPWMDYGEYRQLARESQNRTSKAGQAAVKEIDDLRADYLREHGYRVVRGWRKDAQGKPLPSGSWMVATLK